MSVSLVSYNGRPDAVLVDIRIVLNTEAIAARLSAAQAEAFVANVEAACNAFDKAIREIEVSIKEYVNTTLEST